MSPRNGSPACTAAGAVNLECHLAHCSVPLLFVKDRPMQIPKLIDVLAVVPFALRQLHVMKVVLSLTAQPLQLSK
jgi:hypothetical protein